MSQQEKDTRQGQDTTLSGKQEGTTTQQNRRRLLKAAGMAPVIYTLPTGAATAAGSVMCRANFGNHYDNAQRVGNNSNNVRIGSTGPKFCELTGTADGVGEVCETSENAGDYVFDEHNGTLTTRSCWASLGPVV